MVFSMTTICLMLFLTICTLSASFSVRNSMNANLRELCPADLEIKYLKYADEKQESRKTLDRYLQNEQAAKKKKSQLE